ncbi:MAG: division/cell wall cluster transcriptional repressor MraZ [Anaerolineae bacterium]
MFLGEYSHALDPKGRLTIPARFRGELESGLVITRGYEPCLVIYPLQEWGALADKVARMPMASRTARSYSRLMFGGAFEQVPDKNGRVLVPAFLREYAGIEDDTIVVGVNNYIEVWSPSNYGQVVARDTENMDAILTDVAGMGV